ncbi:hypothetical protein D3C87_518850 [compost metagenome]
MHLATAARAVDPFIHAQTDAAEDLIMTWYRYTLACRPHLGHSNASPMFKDAKPTRGHTEDTLSDREIRIATLQAKQVHVCWEQLPTWQMRAAVDIHAGNRHAGNRLMRNARLSPEQLHEAYQDAKALLIPMFIRRGLMADPLATG